MNVVEMSKKETIECNGKQTKEKKRRERSQEKETESVWVSERRRAQKQRGINGKEMLFFREKKSKYLQKRKAGAQQAEQ